jgi:peptidoglycan/LPS O-acetylase OafA/YrhL
MRYRRDIDGLRAIAIGPVVLLHAGIPGFSGGFVGVDVFFVISGFLITGLNLPQVESGTFSVIDFYDRRIRRIFPALISVYAFCLVAGLVISMPIDLKDLAKSLTSSALFVSNIHFYQSVGYFDAPSLTKPLLHSWSLSVEEQFYVIWPIALIALWRFAKPPRRLPILALASTLSLLHAEWEIGRGNAAAAFYLLPARAWELLAGAMLAIMIPHIRIGPRLAEILAVCGIGLIVAAVVGLSEARDFPGLNAAIPCVGALLLIIAGHQWNTAVTQFISSRAFVFVGIISYSLYLWHWPLFAYWQLAFDRAPRIGEACALVGLSVLVAALSQRFIEQPFRRRPAKRSRTVYAGFGAMAVFIAAGVAISSAQGLPQRFDGEVAELFASAARGLEKRCAGDEKAGPYRRAACPIGTPMQSTSYDVALVGDSHAWHYGPALDALLKDEHLSGRMVSRFGCTPFDGVRAIQGDRELTKCMHFADELAAFLAENKGVKLIVIALRWDFYTQGLRSEAIGKTPVRLIDDVDRTPGDAEASRRVLERALRRLVASLVADGKQVLLIGQVPPYPRTPVNCVARAIHHGSAVSRCFAPASEIRQRLEFSNNLLLRLAAESGAVHAYLPTDTLCDDQLCSLFLNGTFLYRDDDHLNPAGAKQFAQHLAQLPVFSRFREATVVKASAIKPQ